MPNIVIRDVKEVSINGKRIATLFVNGKQVKLTYRITFDTNILTSGTNYFISGQSCSVATPTQVNVPIGTAIGSLPSISNISYTLSGLTYTCNVTAWCTDRACTQPVNTSWVPQQNTTLYAKWGMSALSIANSKNGTFTLPKFASSVAFSATSNGGSRSAVSTNTSTKGYVAFAMSAPGANRTSASKTFTSVGGKSMTLAAMSCTVGSESSSCSTPGAGGGITHTDSVWRNSLSGGPINLYASGNYKITITWAGGPSPGSNQGGTETSTVKMYYPASTLVKTLTYKIQFTNDEGDGKPKSWSGSGGNYTVGSGHYGASGYGVASAISSGSKVTASVTAASGTGWSRSVTIS